MEGTLETEEKSMEIQQPNQLDELEKGVGSTLTEKPEVTEGVKILPDEAQAEIARWKEELLRSKADIENTRRRAQDEIVKARKFAIENFAEHLVSVVDSLEAACNDQSGDINKLREGVELTARQLMKALERGNVLVINPKIGERFDPNYHQAIASVPAEEREANSIVAVLQKGYSIFERVLRPALVTVSAPK